MNLRAVRTLALAQLRLDLRHPRTGRFNASRGALTALAYGFSGLVLALSLGDADPETTLFVAGSFGLVLAAFGVTGSYDELMGRPKENAWLTTLPASEHEQYSARLINIASFLFVVSVSMTAPVGIRLALAHGAADGLAVAALVAGGMVWTAALALAVLWTLTLLLPYVLLRPALSTVRTLLVGLLVLGYQWIGAQEGAANAPWWPAAWLADGLAGRPTLGLGLFVGSVLLLMATFAVYFPGRYFLLLRRLADGAQREEGRARERRELMRGERLLVRAPAARAAYGFALSAFRDDRLVRGRLWPAALLPLGFGLFGWWMGGLGDLFLYSPEEIISLPDTRLHLSLLVILLFCAQSLVQTLQFSDHAEAAWLYETLPGARSRVLQLGAQQALLYRVLLPLHAVLALVLMTRMGLLHATLHAAFWFAVAALTTRAYALIHRRPPFARRSDRFSAGARFLPLVVSIPSAILVLVIQLFTFTTPIAAAQAILGMLVVHAALAQFVTRFRTRLRRPRFVAPAPATASV